jgi:hypothetical protein
MRVNGLTSGGWTLSSGAVDSLIPILTEHLACLPESVPVVRLVIYVSYAGIARDHIHVLLRVVVGGSAPSRLVQDVGDDLIDSTSCSLCGGGGVGGVAPSGLFLHLTHHLRLLGGHQEESCTK